MKATRPNWTARLAAFDIETTGLDVTKDRIVTAALVLLENGKEVACHNWLLNPGVPIHPAAIKTHGITDEHAQTHGVQAQVGVAQIAQQIAQAQAQGYVLVAYNAPYDLTMLSAEIARYQVPVELDLSRVVDPLVIDKYLDRYRRGKRTLTATCEHYQIALTNAHSADADARAALYLAYHLAAVYYQQLNMPIAELTAAQVAWEKELTLSFRDYLARNGRDVSQVVPGWPIKKL